MNILKHVVQWQSWVCYLHLETHTKQTEQAVFMTELGVRSTNGTEGEYVNPTNNANRLNSNQQNVNPDLTGFIIILTDIIITFLLSIIVMFPLTAPSILPIVIFARWST